VENKLIMKEVGFEKKLTAERQRELQPKKTARGGANLRWGGKRLKRVKDHLDRKKARGLALIKKDPIFKAARVKKSRMIGARLKKKVEEKKSQSPIEERQPNAEQKTILRNQGASRSGAQN